MNIVKVRNISIGEGRPKICVPIVERTAREIIAKAEGFGKIPVDIVEWRADWYDDVSDIDKVLDTVKELRKVLGETPLLFTFRTLREGGEKTISAEQYSSLNVAVAKSGNVDLIDVEVFFEEGAETVKYIISTAQEAGVKVIGSNHHFHETPEKDDMVSILRKMQAMGVDIPKIAVMPTNKCDVIKLLEATLEMSEKYADRPIITMSMASAGIISRISGQIFGSAVTFGSVDRASAPGQIEVRELESVLEILHKNMKLE